MTKTLIAFFLVLLLCPVYAQTLKEMKNMSEIFSYCSEKQFVVFGEIHGIDIINDIRLESIKYNLKKGRKTHLLLEMGASSELAFTNYIFKDSVQLNPFLRFSESFMDSLKILASQYPEQLWIHGIDVELSLNLYVEDFQKLKILILDESLKNRISNLLPHEVLTKKEKKKKRRKIKRLVEECADYFEKENIKNTPAINFIKQGIESFIFQDKGLVKGSLFRDKVMYNTIQQILKLFPNDYFYMQIGLHHSYNFTDKKNWKTGLSYLLNNTPNSLVFKKVFSIAQGVVNCKSKRVKGNFTSIEDYPLKLNKDIINYFKVNKWEIPICYSWQPKEKLNTFDLYIITVGYDVESMKEPKNKLHLIYN